MSPRIPSRDWEAISAYLDGELPSKEHSRLEARLESSPDLRAALDEMRRTRSLLRSQPRLRAPRNFTLTAQMVGLQRGPTPRFYPALRLTSALATFLFALTVAGQLLLGRLPAAAPLAASMPNEAPVAMEAQVEAAEAPAPEAAKQAPASQPTQAAQMEMPAPAATAEGIGGGPTAAAPQMIPAGPYPTPELQPSAIPPGIIADQPQTSTFSLQAVEPSAVETGEAASASADTAYPPPAALAQEAAQEAQPEGTRQAAEPQSGAGGILLPVQVALAAIALGAGLGAYWLRRR